MPEATFLALFSEHFLQPELALESEDLRKALRSKNDQEVKRILLEDF